MVQRAIRPDWLLRQADELGYRGSGQGQPRNTNLRRAVSSAYYAAFHAVVGEVTLFLLPDGTPDERHRLGRSITHTNQRNACEYILTPNKAPIECRPIAQAAAANVALVDFAEALLSLQEARHRADYDHLADFTKAGTLQLVDEARAAVASLYGLRGTPDIQRFVSMLVLRPVLR